MKRIIFSIFLFSLTLVVQAQSNTKISGQSLSQLQSTSILNIHLPHFQNYKIATTSTVAPPLSAIFKNYNTSTNTEMPKAWAYEDLAFFCKIEVQLEKTAKLPIKFRIGEVQQVEKMEGKLK